MNSVMLNTGLFWEVSALSALYTYQKSGSVSAVRVVAAIS